MDRLLHHIQQTPPAVSGAHFLVIIKHQHWIESHICYEFYQHQLIPNLHVDDLSAVYYDQLELKIARESVHKPFIKPEEL